MRQVCQNRLCITTWLHWRKEQIWERVDDAAAGALGVMRIEGADARTFLQGQLSNDLRAC